jgi:transcriptional regulator with XRE-family HTH domain
VEQKKIGSFLKELRKEKVITQEQFAEELNVSGRTVSRWETGSNMPDISLLVEIADFYDISILEIINGERKSEKMNKEVKEVAESLSDYATLEKENVIKNIRTLSISGVCALLVYAILDITGAIATNNIFGAISDYCLALVFVTTIFLPLYTTGLLSKIDKRKKQAKPVTLFNVILAAAIGFGIAYIIKFVLSFIIH